MTAWWAHCQNCYSGQHATKQCGYPTGDPWPEVVRKASSPTHDVARPAAVPMSSAFADLIVRQTWRPTCGALHPRWGRACGLVPDHTGDHATRMESDQTGERWDRW